MTALKNLKKDLTKRCFYVNILRSQDYAGVVQWLEFQPSKLAVWVRFPSPAPNRQFFGGFIM